MEKLKTKELDSLFVLRHAQRRDKVSSTISSIDFHSNTGEYTIGDSYNPGLATFQTTNNKSNNGYVQSMELGKKLLTYIKNQISEETVVLKFHTSPYLRCIETIKLITDYIVRKHSQDETSKSIKITISIDHVLSEWLNTELDINYYPPNDNGISLLTSAIQYLNSNLPYNRNEKVKISLNFNDSYKHGNPGPFSEGILQQFQRLNQGLISIIKSETENQSLETNSKDIVLIMTHGACIRSLVSKILGKSLYVEIPLASISLVKPTKLDSKHYYWKLIETDIELKNLNFNEVDLYSKRDPFQDFHTTFNHKSSQLNFQQKELTPASKTENFNRLRSQSLLNPKSHSVSDSESDDSDNEGLSFSVKRVATNPSQDDNHRRFRSSSLFGPTLRNPFFEDKNKQIKNTKASFERSLSSLRKTNKTSSSTTTISPFKSTRKHSINAESSYQNIDEDDGIHDWSSSEKDVPGLEELSSNNSSTNSLINEEITAFPGTFSKLQSDNILESNNSLSTLQDLPITSHSSSILNHHDKDQSFHEKIKKNSSSSIFDKSLIEKSMKELAIPEDEDFDDEVTINEDNNNYLSFRKDILEKPKETNKFKIDLYGKKNRYKLSLYSDSNDEFDQGEEDVGGKSGWFLGSNRY